MRCADLTHELAVPTGRIDRASLDAHLASCPSCAVEARRGLHLDQIWDATRPLPPSPLAFEQIWAEVERRAEVPAQLQVATSSRRRWVRPSFIGVGLAQAAAVLIAVSLNGGHAQPDNPPALVQGQGVLPAPPVETLPSVTKFVEIEEGKVAILKVLPGGIELVERKPNEWDALLGDEIGSDLALLNYFEGEAPLSDLQRAEN